MGLLNADLSEHFLKILLTSKEFGVEDNDEPNNIFPLSEVLWSIWKWWLKTKWNNENIETWLGKYIASLYLKARFLKDVKDFARDTLHGR